MVQVLQDEVIEFINRRFPIDCNWTSGNCYWFAKLLCDRFSYLDIFYVADVGHFIAGNGIYFYDFNGLYNINADNKYLYLFSELKYTDPNWYARLIKDCIK